MDATEAQAVVELLQAFAPLADRLADSVLAYGPATGRVLDAVRSGLVQARVRSVREYMDAGFEANDAILLTLSDAEQARGFLKHWDQNQKARTARSK